MGKSTIENHETFLLNKKVNYKVKVTTRIKGDCKNKFIDHCIKTGLYESCIAAHIISVYVDILDQHPELKDKELPEIKQFILDKTGM